MENTIKKFAEVLQNDPNMAYDFVAINYHYMSKMELADIAKELLYAIYVKAQEEHDAILKSAGEELAEQYAEE